MNSRIFLNLSFAMMIAAPSTQATQLYWDVDGSGVSGFGTVVGGWDNANAFWNTDSTGAALGSVVSTTTSADDLIIAQAAINTGSITVTGPQNASSITFASDVGPTALITGGTIMIGGSGSSSGIFQQSTGANTIATGLTLKSDITAFNFSNSNSGLLTIGAVTGAATSGTQTITVGASSTGGITLGGIIGNGAGGGRVALNINSSGAGITTLSGASTFTGGVTMTAGTASFTSTGLGSASAANKITFAGNSTLRWGAATTTDLSSRLIINSGVTATLDTGANNVTFGSVFGLENNSKGTLNKTGSGILTLGNTVNQFAGNIVISNGRVALGGQYAMWQSAYDTTGSTGAIGLNVTGQATPWLGGLAGSVDLATAITGYGSVTTLTLNPQSGSSVSYGGVISNGSGSMPLNKTGHGTQTLTGTNSYTGATTVWAGTLALAGNGSILYTGSPTPGITVRGGILELDNTAGWIVGGRIADANPLSLGSLTLTSSNGAGIQSETVGATTFAVGGKVTINNGTTGGDQTTLALGAVTRSAGAAINFVGTGGTLGGGANSPNVTSSSLPANTNGVLPWATVNGTQWAENNSNSIRAYSGSFVDPTSAASAATSNAQLSGSGTIASAKSFNSLNVISSGAGQSLNLSANTGNLTLTSGAILKSGTDAYTISSSGSPLGNITAGAELIAHVDGGALTISAPLNTAIEGIAKGGAGDLILSGTRDGTLANAISIAGGQLEFRGNSTTLNGVVTGAGGLTVNLNPGQTLNLNSNSNSYAGPTIVKGGYLSSNGYANEGMPGGRGQTPNTNTSLIMSNLILQGGVWYSRYVTNKDLGAGPGQVQILAGTSGFVHDANSGGAAGLTLDGGRELVWGSTYFNPTVFVHSTIGNLTLNLANGIDLAGSTRTVLVGDATYNALAGGGSSQLGGVIRDSIGTAGLTKTGVGILLLSGANTFNGPVTVNAGTLTAGNATALGASTGSLAVNNPNTGAGTAVVLNLSTTAATTKGSLSGTIATPASGTNTARINNGGQLFTVNQTTDGDYAGGIAGTGGFTLGSLSTNTLTLRGANTYTGATTVSAGTLALGASGSINSSPTIHVGGTGVYNVSAVTGGYHLLGTQTLTGIGTVAGSVTADSGSTVAPGSGVSGGTLTFSSGPLALAEGAKIQVSNPGSSLVQVNGDYVDDLSAHTLLLPSSITPNTPYTFLQWTGTPPAGMVTGAQSNWSVQVTGVSTVNCIAATSNDWTSATTWDKLGGVVNANTVAMTLSFTAQTGAAPDAANDVIIDPTTAGITITGPASTAVAVKSLQIGGTNNQSPTLTLGAANFNVTGAVNVLGNGTLNATDGALTATTLNVNGAGAAATLGNASAVTTANVNAGTLNFNSTSASNGTLAVTGGTTNIGPGAKVSTADFSAGAGTVNAATNALNITTQLKLAGGATASGNFTATGANLANNSTARTLTLSGGTLTFSVPAALPTAALKIDASVLAAGSITTLANLGTGGNSLTVNSGNVSVSAAINGRNALVFTGANAFTSANAYSLTGSSAMTIFSVATSASGANSGYDGYLSFNAANGADWSTTGSMAAITADNAGNAFAPTRNSASLAGVGTAMPQGTANPFITAQTFNGTTSTFKVINLSGTATTATPVTNAAHGNFNITQTAIGGRLTGGAGAVANLWSGAVGEVLVYNSTLSAADILAVETYLKAKWFGIGTVPSSDTNLPNTSIAATASSVLDMGASAGAHNLAALNLTAGSTSTDLLLANGVSLTLNGDSSNNAISATGSAGQTASVLPDATSPPSLIIASGKNVSVDSGVTLTVQSVISGGAVTKIGNGTLTLSADNTYTGATTVTGGTLLINGDHTGGGLITVEGGATLGGSGTMGEVTVDNLGILAPGNSAGQITVGPLTLNDTSVLMFELGAPTLVAAPAFSDHVLVNGNLRLDGKLQVTAGTGFPGSPSIGDKWLLMSYSGSLDDNTLVVDSAPGGPYVINTDTAGSVFLIVAVPEAGTAGLLALGLLLLRRLRRP